MKYFSYDEFASPDLEGSGTKMNAQFITMLNQARANAGIPFVINSGYRTPAHNQKVGGKTNSSHLRGYAADIKISGSRDRYLITRALLNAGFNRIGIANTFIHIDNDPEKDKNVIWTY